MRVVGSRLVVIVGGESDGEGRIRKRERRNTDINNLIVVHRTGYF